MLALLEKIIWIAGIGMEVLLVGIISRRGVARRVPMFLAYFYWLVLSDIACLMVTLNYSYSRYLIFFDVQLMCDGLLLFLVLFDLARSVLRPLPMASSRGILILLLLVMVSGGSIIWRVSDSWSLFARFTPWHVGMRLELTFALLRVLFLLLLAALIQFLSSHFIPVVWGERELQIATGIGGYALVSLATSLLHTYQLPPATFRAISDVVSIGFFLCLIYWLVCFLRPERNPAEQSGQIERSPVESVASTLWRRAFR